MDINEKLMIAIRAYNVEQVKECLAQGADANFKGKVYNYDMTPLLAIAYTTNKDEYKSPEIVKLLIDNGADVNAKTNFNSTALHYAVINGNSIENIKFLIDNGADVNAKNYEGKTALEIYKENKLLIPNNAIISLLQPKMQIVPKTKANTKQKSNNFEMEM